jgi:transposase
MKAMVARRHQLIGIRTAENNRLEHALDKVIARSINRMLKTIDREIEKIEIEIQEQLASMPELENKAHTHSNKFSRAR